MPRYFFDEVLGDDILGDDEGIDLPDVAAAKREALDGAREQIAEAARQGIDATDRAFRVKNVIGDVIFTLEFRDAVRRAARR